MLLLLAPTCMSRTGLGRCLHKDKAGRSSNSRTLIVPYYAISNQHQQCMYMYMYMGVHMGVCSLNTSTLVLRYIIVCVMISLMLIEL